MSTSLVSAGQIMDRVANLLNDPSKSDYTYAVQIPYLNLAIEEYSDSMAEANAPFTNLTSLNSVDTPIIIPKGERFLLPSDSPNVGTHPTYPAGYDLIEIQEIGERVKGDTGSFRRLNRKEFGQWNTAVDSLGYWSWENGVILFNMNGASVDMEVELKFITQGVGYVANENTMINAIGSRTFLAYKTAALCAFYIGENESRAKVLDGQAETALERSINISSKGRQQIMTRHRPFRASYKARRMY